MKRLAALLLLGAVPASAGEVTSLYSDLDLERCQMEKPPDDEAGGGEWLCEGIPGEKVQVWEGDLRSFVGFGQWAPAQCASVQTFFAFNSLGPKVEWRLDDGKPFATILRWHTDRGDGEVDAKQDWLVVTKMNGRDACHAAYIGAEMPEANALARKAADGIARGFDCATDTPSVTAKKGGTAGNYAGPSPCAGGPYREE